jgi:hypothetical protein
LLESAIGAELDEQREEDREEERTVSRDRDPVAIDAARSDLIRRLHRHADDFDATRALARLNEAAGNLPQRSPVVTRST